MPDHKTFNLRYKRLSGSLSRLQLSPEVDLQPLIKSGLVAFDNTDFWMAIEHAVINDNETENNEQLALDWIHILRVHRNTPELDSPTTIKSIDGNLRLLRLYGYSIGFIKECICSFNKAHQERGSLRKAYARSAVKALVIMQSDKRIVNALREHGLKALIDDQSLATSSKQLLNKSQHAGIGVLLRSHSPQIMGVNKSRHEALPPGAARTSFFHNGWNVDTSLISYLFPKLEAEIKSYIKSTELPFNKDQGSKQPYAIRTIRSTISMINFYHHELSDNQQRTIKEDGVKAFLNDNGALLRWIIDKRTTALLQTKNSLNVKPFAKSTTNTNMVLKGSNGLIRLLSFVTQNENSAKHYLPEYLSFSNSQNIEEPIYLNVSHIFEGYPRLFDNLRATHSETRTSKSSDVRRDITLMGTFTGFARTIRLTEKHFSETEKQSLSKDGLSAFAGNNCKLLKKVRQELQTLAYSGKLELTSAQNYQYAVNWMLIKAGFKVIESYPISTKRRSVHKKNRAKTYHSIEECQEIAFYIEKLLKNKSTPPLHQIWLILARVYIKTGWNLTPVLDLEVDDLMDFATPIAGNSTYFIRLFKRRAGYKTQFHKFTLSGKEVELNELESGKAVSNALHDLLHLRDTVCIRARDKLDKNHHLKKRICVYIESGEVKAVTKNSFHSGIKRQLRAAGCDIVFNTTKIRKGGLNHVYQDVEKNFRKYKVAGNHTFSVFARNYLLVNPEEKEKTLAKAISIMGDYFHGRDITNDITIVTEIQSTWQKTPNGECGSAGNDNAAKIYNKKHHKLHKEQEIENSRCAEFNACLWCPYFRTVADAEHVWKLLSYRDYVLADMKASVTDYENTEKQKEFVNTLTWRVNEILQKLKSLNPSSVIEGKRLITTDGMHPFWEFASSTTRIN